MRATFVALACGLWLLAAAAAGAQSRTQATPADFPRLVAQLTSDRVTEDAGSEAVQEQALAILDRVALGQLNTASPSLDAVNQSLAALAAHQPPIGESYRVVPLGTNPATYALAANFSSAGPSAVRLYSGAPGQLNLIAHVDRYAQKDFFDDYVVIVSLSDSKAFVSAVPPTEALLVTVAGRTDDLQTGVFTAWHFDGHNISALWTSDILQQSSYRLAPDGFWLTYCGEMDSADFSTCRSMRRDQYVWIGGAWKNSRKDTWMCAAKTCAEGEAGPVISSTP